MGSSIADMGGLDGALDAGIIKLLTSTDTFDQDWAGSSM